MARSPKQYPKRPIPEEFIDYMFVTLGEPPSNEILEKWWDREWDYQRLWDCPPNCTHFEYHTHPELKQ